MSILQAKNVSLAGKTLMSGIQPTGTFHIGNLLGAVQTWVDFSRVAPDNSNIVFMIADLHALTVAKPPKLLAEYRWKALASLLAVGIDPSKCSLYFQSQVPTHAELHWILSSVSSMGYLSRMTQWKAKTGAATDAAVHDSLEDGMKGGATRELLRDMSTNLALFSYPTLQAADILIHRADFVPVGDDQSQHLELSRHIAQSFNHRFGRTFSVPSTVLTPFKKILSLKDPSKKMSKSDPDANACITMTDDSATIHRKIKRAVTDSVQGPITFDPASRPGVANLLMIGSGVVGVEPEKYLAQHSLQTHSQLKEAVSASVEEYIGPIRARYAEIEKDKSYLQQVAAEAAEKVNERTLAELKRVKKVVGLD